MVQGLPCAGTVSARWLRRFIPRPGMELWREQIEIEMLREGAPNVEMEGLEPEDEEDKNEGDVEDIELG